MEKTPRSRIKGMLRQIFLRSRERGFAMKRSGYCCEKCGVKQSKSKAHPQRIDVHHKKGIPCWNTLIDLIYEHLLCNPDDLEVLCPNCHYDETYGRLRLP